MAVAAGVLARGPWPVARVSTRWLEECFEPESHHDAAADAAVEALQERGSPSHDGLAARLAGYRADSERLELELQPMRWSLRLVEGGASDSLTALTVVRSADGRWLAGRRAPWVATWAGRWALGAGGSVEVGENPATTLTRELEEEWSLQPERISVEALARLPSGLTVLVGLAWLAEGAEPVPDAEHDAWAWWPREVADWPEEATSPLRRMAELLA
jgi:ADP-ribose pyrophosphatase YjhB (NUDIX family)